MTVIVFLLNFQESSFHLGIFGGNRKGFSEVPGGSLLSEVKVSIQIVSSVVNLVPLGGPRQRVRQPLGLGVQRVLHPLLGPLQGCAEESGDNELLQCCLRIKEEEFRVAFFLEGGSAEPRER